MLPDQPDPATQSQIKAEPPVEQRESAGSGDADEDQSDDEDGEDRDAEDDVEVRTQKSGAGHKDIDVHCPGLYPDCSNSSGNRKKRRASPHQKEGKVITPCHGVFNCFVRTFAAMILSYVQKLTLRQFL